MNIEDARIYCLGKENATEDFPFDETTLAFRVENRIFAIVDLEKRLAVIEQNTAFLQVGEHG